MSEQQLLVETTPDAAAIRASLDDRPIVFIGLMGAGKTVIGRKVAQILDLDFIDTDTEIESAARMTIPELFEQYGEPEFRALESRVIARVMKNGARVVSTGGGAFMQPDTRGLVLDHAISVWLKADLDVLMERVMKKQNRPLLKNADPRGVMQRLMDERYPIYAQASLTVVTRDEKRDVIAGEVIAALGAHLGTHGASS